MPQLIKSLSYEPVELGFGTSGLRGLVADMTDIECYINSIAFLDYVAAAQGLLKGSVIFVGGDLRESTPRIMKTIVKAIEDAGYQSCYCGLLPTPALALYAQENNGPCIMVTGSHIPADRNGIKFYKLGGEVLKSDEAPIKQAVAIRRQTLYESNAEASLFGPDGMLISYPDLPTIESQAEQAYIVRYTDIVDRPLTNKHIVVYQHSAVGRDMLCQILESLGARVTAVGRSDVFIPIDSENVTPANKQYFRSLSEEYPDTFAIVSTDGDSDRPFLIDEHGEFYRGDIVGCIIAKELGADFVAVPISSNDAVDKFFESLGIKLVHTKIGSPYVVEAMQAAANAVRPAGWEVNGGFLLGNNVPYKGTQLRALPTRDAILPIVAVLVAAVQSKQKLSELFATLPQRFTGGGLLDNIDLSAINKLKQLGQDNERLTALIKRVFAGTDLGEVDTVDTTDGIRVYFAGRDIVHIRPSGNAPQLRIYTNADSQQRADKLAEDATASGGLLENFIQALNL